MNLKSLREKRKLRQSDIAEALKVDRTTVTKWETGKSMPNAAKLLELSKFLKCSVDKILKIEM